MVNDGLHWVNFGFAVRATVLLVRDLNTSCGIVVCNDEVALE